MSSPTRLLRSFRSIRNLKSDAQRQEHRSRQPSESSTITRPSTESSRPSTSRTDNSLDWDPLRLHPPMTTPRPPSGIHDHFEAKPQYHILRESQSSFDLQSTRTRSAQTTSLEIYEGFDFGFAQKRAAQLHDEHIASMPSPPTSSTAEFPGRTPRPQREDLDAPDYFMRRGTWKRRGIVFAVDSPIATQDECFDLGI